MYDILIIDDEAVINEAVIKIAETEGLKIDSCTNARDGLKKLEKDHYKITLCDIMMPEMNGFQLLNEVKSESINTHVIMITGFSTVENAVKSLHMGAIDFIPKPFTYDEIISSIYRGLEFCNLQERIRNSINGNDDDTIIYVPCPPKYLKLGNTSWMNLEYEGAAVIGVTDLFLRTIKSLSSVELFDVDEILIQGNTCSTLLTEDEIPHNIMAPIGGKIVERNEKLLENFSLLEKDPYFEGWLYRIIPADIEYDMKYLTPCSTDRV
ncbi:MAG: response regulator [Bacteroidota bacterium]